MPSRRGYVNVENLSIQVKAGRTSSTVGAGCYTDQCVRLVWKVAGAKTVARSQCSLSAEYVSVF